MKCLGFFVAGLVGLLIPLMRLGTKRRGVIRLGDLFHSFICRVSGMLRLAHGNGPARGAQPRRTPQQNAPIQEEIVVAERELIEGEEAEMGGRRRLRRNLPEWRAPAEA